MMIRVNGKDLEMKEGGSVAELLVQLGLSTSPCAVEVNKNLVPKSRHAQHVLHEADMVEIVTLVGGG